MSDVTGSALLVIGCIPVALSNSEGAGSVRALVRLPGPHLYKQVLGNERTKRLRWFPSLTPHLTVAVVPVTHATFAHIRRSLTPIAARKRTDVPFDRIPGTSGIS